MLTAKRPDPRTASWVLLAAFRQTSSIGGSIDSEETALTVTPYALTPVLVVITTTPLMKLPITRRNTAPSTSVTGRSAGRPMVSTGED